MRYRWLAVLFLFVMGAVQAEEQTAPAAAAKELSVLTIGNSFAENALKFLPQIAQSAGYKLIVGRANLGGCPLDRHWSLVEAFEKNPDDPKGRYNGKVDKDGKVTGESLKQKLTSRKWDFVTIQQYSYISHDPATYEPFAKNLVEYIKKNAPDTKILVHHTWAYRVDDPQFATKKEGKPASQQEMYEKVHAAYEGMAKELGLQVIPSGPAFHMVDTNAEWGYKPDSLYDRKTAAEGKLPEQKHSLHAGYSIKKGKDGKESLGMDGHHANKAGEYLAGLCYFETMTGVDSNTIKYAPEEVEPDFAAFLRKTAHEAVQAEAAAK